MIRGPLERVVMALLAAMRAYDPELERHSRRVELCARDLGRALGLAGLDAWRLRVAALLHDVGKIGVPEAILKKPGALSADELEEIEQHIEIGARLLSLCGFDEATVRLVACHEERWDGRVSGEYAGRFGLRATEIPLGARIVAVADAFDAMTHDRPYRSALPVGASLEELVRGSGSQFDPEVVACLVRAVGARSRRNGDLTERLSQPES